MNRHRIPKQSSGLVSSTSPALNESVFNVDLPQVIAGPSQVPDAERDRLVHVGL
jgi:hypothetical protein